MLRCKFYVCPICGNIMHSTGDSLVSCCGITLPPLEAEAADEPHGICIENVEDEHYLTVDHPMTKQHYISFLAYVTSDRIQMVKLYPEGNAQTRMQLRGFGMLYWYCNQHGLFKKKPWISQSHIKQGLPLGNPCFFAQPIYTTLAYSPYTITGSAIVNSLAAVPRMKPSARVNLGPIYSCSIRTQYVESIYKKTLLWYDR